MKNLMLLLMLSTLGLSVFANARDTKMMLSIADAMGTADAKQVLSQGIELYWGGQSYALPSAHQGEYVASRKASAINVSDMGACYTAFIKAVRSLQDRAYAEGGNAVVNIRSFYDQNAVSSENQFECHAGAMIAGVALKGEVVTLPGAKLPEN